MPTEKQVIETLSKVIDPELHRSLTELKMVREVQVQDGRVEVTCLLFSSGGEVRQYTAPDGDDEQMPGAGNHF